VDCTDADALRSIVDRYPIDGVVHLAAGPLDPRRPIDAAEADIRALLAVLRIAGERDVRRLTVASTIGVYAGLSTDRYREDDLLAPLPPHPVPALRRAAEALATTLSDRTVMVRIGAIWGPGGRGASPFFAAPQLVHAAALGGWPADVPPPHADEGIDMLYASDCGRAIATVHVAAELRHRIHNIGSGTVTTNRQVVEALGGALPLRPGRGRPGPDIPMDVSRISELGFVPRFPLAAALADYRAHIAASHSR